MVLLGFNWSAFEWRFTIADVAHPLLGADFLQVHSLLVDVEYKRLVDAKTFSIVPLTIFAVVAPQLSAIGASTNKYHQLLS